MTTLPSLRDVVDLAGCRAVVDVQMAVWGQDAETVPASVLVASIKRGGILIGAYDGAEPVGFVWSMPGWKDGQPTQWSHMLGVMPHARGRGLAIILKREQRARARVQGIDLIEWTFDPLQAANAHLNIARLGAISTAYLVDAYGAMTGPLHHGTPTDRLIAEWWIARPHVERRLGAAGGLTARSADVLDAASAVTTRRFGEWIECAGVNLDLETPRITISVPARFTDMQRQARDSALAWRLASRDVFGTYFARGYRVVDFFMNREEGSGEYLLAALPASNF